MISYDRDRRFQSEHEYDRYSIEPKVLSSNILLGIGRVVFLVHVMIMYLTKRSANYTILTRWYNNIPRRVVYVHYSAVATFIYTEDEFCQYSRGSI